MKYIKIYLIVLVFFCVSGFLCGCSDDGETPEEDAGSSDKKEDSGTAPSEDAGEEEEGPPDLPDSCEREGNRLNFEELDTSHEKGDVKWFDVTRGPEVFAAAWVQKVVNEDEWGLFAGFVSEDFKTTGSFVDIAPDPAFAAGPAIIWNEDAYIIMWRDARWNSSCTQSSSCGTDLAMVSIDENGVMEGTVNRITTGGNVTGRPVMLKHDEGIIALWLEQETGALNEGSIFAIAMSSEGEITGQRKKISGDSEAMELPFSAAADKDGVIVAWMGRNENGFLIQKIDRNADMVGSSVRVDTGNLVQKVNIKSRGTGGYYAAWSQKTGDSLSGTEIYSAQINKNLKIGGEILQHSWTDGNALNPALAEADDGWVVLWDSDRAQGASKCRDKMCTLDVYFQLAEDSGEPLTHPLRVTEDRNQCSRGTAFSVDDGFIVFWVATRQYREALFARKVQCSL